jgi:hypothetical protein
MNGHSGFLRLDSEFQVYYKIAPLRWASSAIVPGADAFAAGEAAYMNNPV